MREVLLEVKDKEGVRKASLKVERLCALLDPSRKALGADQLVNSSAALRIRAEINLKGVIAESAHAQTQPSTSSVPAPVLEVGPAESTPNKMRLSRLEERREQAAVTERRVLIGREVLVYLAEQGQLDVDAFNLLEF